MRLYLNERPRTFIVTSTSHALIIRHPSPKYRSSSGSHLHIHHHHHHRDANGAASDLNTANNAGSGLSNKVLVEFVKKDDLDLSRFKDITPSKTRSNKQILGFLGLLNMKSNIYIGFITSEETVASPTVREKVNRITAVDFYCLNNDEYDHLINKSVDDEPDYFSNPQQTPLSSQQSQLAQERDKLRNEYPATSVRKLLSSGSFYYSRNFDVCSNIQERGNPDEKNPKFQLVADSPYFKRFMWNSFMNSELIEFRNRLTLDEQQSFDTSGFLVTMIRGYAKTVNVVINKEDALMTLISKQSCIKNGPLFGEWGCDDNGAVSNFVETEVIIYTQKYCLAYVMVRGNAPIYWELENHFSKKNILPTNKNSKKVVYPRSFEASQHAFTRHFDRLANQYGEIHILSALSRDASSYKGDLNATFESHIEFFNNNRERNQESSEQKDMEITDKGNHLSHPNYKLEYTHVPITVSLMKKLGYSAQNPHDIVALLVDSIVDYGALLYDSSKKTFIGKQLGVFRMNSFDSLNKANYISKIISQEVIELAFRDIGIALDIEVFIKHAKLWSENEDVLSKLTLNFISNSTKLQTSSATSTKSSVKSHLTKKYLSGVVDTKPNVSAMLKLLGRLQDQVSISLHNPIHDYVAKELSKRTKEYSSYKDISVFASTFNVNGTFYDGDLREWLFPTPKYTIEKSYDLVFIGFQEIVELNASQMVNTDVGNKIQWERKIKKTLDDHNPEGIKYFSLWSGQIGGMALLLFVREEEINNISNVEGSFKKTGLGGMSANKGGVAVSFNYSNTDICFVTSHFAAGLSNIEERHHNYKTLIKGMLFSKNRKIRNHDAVIWSGDFNYRIGLPIESVKSLVEKQHYSKLFEFDQLNTQMANGESFPFFDEMEIKFAPTYKFDNGTKTYDTSEKQRIPAWTDRILNLSRNKIIKQSFYDCADDVIFSDHRPVFALFNIKVHIVNQAVKKNLSNELYENYRKNYGDINDIFGTNSNIWKLFEEEKVLPPPSSEIQKWWLEGGKAAKVYIPELNNEKVNDGDINIINPRYPVNPFEETEEPEFLSKSELLKLLSDK
ncbi:inositol-1,4,5-triphosphate 5-phosphatase [Scheffersomyces xylosifermentans]|uniref:inositol-1,4,5-triphosphate 5-phosphatase n=1 Tax=Scheffersomyces xylosifermentans TaxID=1304137 RepID=UPI00315CC092